MSQRSLSFARFDDEMELAESIRLATGRDLFKGDTDTMSRKATARIAIVINKLGPKFERAFERIYGEPVKGEVSIDRGAA
jgi:hypothetical protein